MHTCLSCAVLVVYNFILITFWVGVLDCRPNMLLIISNQYRLCFCVMLMDWNEHKSTEYIYMALYYAFRLGCFQLETNQCYCHAWKKRSTLLLTNM